MPSISIPDSSVAITAASAQGVITTGTDNSKLFPGAKCWISKTDGSAQARCKIISLVGTTGCKVRRYPNDDDTQFAGYGQSDLSAFNTGSVISTERQVVPIDPAFSKLL